MAVSFKKTTEEIKRIGLKATIFRIKQLIRQKTKTDLINRPITTINNQWFQKFLPSDAPSDDIKFLAWWKKQPQYFFGIHTSKDIAKTLNLLNTAEQINHIKTTGKKASNGVIKSFCAHDADFKSPINWYLNPKSGAEWPKEHSFRTLTAKNKKDCGDIKLTWEIGRFLHIPDILRAWVLTGDDQLILDLFEQVTSFEAENPLYQGAHWLSEQEIAIRGAMLALALMTLRDSLLLTGDILRLFLRQITAVAEYCMVENDFARNCITNNHFIAGALGPYIAYAVMPWNKSAPKWHKTSRRWLVEALDTQWYDDGGYTQPAHNYHRLTLNYLLWVHRIADISDDDDLKTAINQKFTPSFNLLYHMLADSENGLLPNWGPNDGAQFCSWTSCDYPDFRPLLTSLYYALTGNRLFDTGIWDEQLFWLWGKDAVNAPVEKMQCPPIAHFPHAGLHVIKGDESFLCFRAGNILSRYGQQADQMHIDFWWRGINIFTDAGSYMYGDKENHEWFRSTAAHNTICVNNESQMIPHRQFLFLGWPNVDTIPLPKPVNHVQYWYAAKHDGYTRLNPAVTHARIIIQLKNNTGWVAIDKIKAEHYKDADTSLPVSQNWTIDDCPCQINEDSLTAQTSKGHFSIKWASSQKVKAIYTPYTAQKNSISWLSRYYGQKKPMNRLSLETTIEDTDILILTWFGAEEYVPQELSINADTNKFTLDNTTIDIPNSFLKA